VEKRINVELAFS